MPTYKISEHLLSLSVVWKSENSEHGPAQLLTPVWPLWFSQAGPTAQLYNYSSCITVTFKCIYLRGSVT